MKKKYLIILLLLTVTGVGGCEKNDTKEYNLEPKNATYQKAILGKWKLIAQGGASDDVIHPLGQNEQWTEYLSNWTIRTDNAVELFYRIDAKFLYEYYNDGAGNYGKEANTHVYKYHFNDNADELTLQHIKGNVAEIYPFIDIHVYKKMN
jgi:hypothetical protein